MNLLVLLVLAAGLVGDASAAPDCTYRFDYDPGSFFEGEKGKWIEAAVVLEMRKLGYHRVKSDRNNELTLSLGELVFCGEEPASAFRTHVAGDLVGVGGSLEDRSGNQIRFDGSSTDGPFRSRNSAIKRSLRHAFANLVACPKFVRTAKERQP